MLFAADRHGMHAGTVFHGRQAGEAAPAAADLQHALVRLQAQHLAGQTAVFVQLRFFQAFVTAPPQGG